jgi:hypothetical protein
MTRWILCALLLWSGAASAQTSDPKPPAVERLGPTLYRLGAVQVDTAKREVRVAATLNDVTVLEFLANTKGGAKAYESALTLDTDAITFNAALLMIGLDPARGKPSKMQFDETPPEGDPVEITVEFRHPKGMRPMKIEELIYDQRTKATLPAGPWVYTGSTFIDTGFGRRYLADLDGVVIGLMHGPQAIIDNPRSDAVKGFGSVVLNPNLGFSPNTPATLTVKALNR